MAESSFTDDLPQRALDTIATVVALAVLVLVSGGVIRLTTVYLFDHKVWISYLALGALFCLGGAFAYSRRGVAPHGDA